MKDQTQPGFGDHMVMVQMTAMTKFLGAYGKECQPQCIPALFVCGGTKSSHRDWHSQAQDVLFTI